MKLYDGAVFLIIAGAVIGPIHSQDKSFYNGGFCQLNDCALSQQAAEECSTFGEYAIMWRECIKREMAVFETTSETCERALREVGAWAMKLREDGTVQELTQDPKLWFTQEHNYIWAIGGMYKPVRVLCIPSPLGLVQ